MNRRYFSETTLEAPEVTLAGAEAHHLLHVLRARPGMSVVLFDGGGAEFDAVVMTCNRSTVDLSVGERRTVSRELSFPLVLGVALPKGDRQRWIVEKAVELGVSRLVPLVTEHGGPAAELQPSDKLRRYVIEASKQCGRNVLMPVDAPRPWHQWVEETAAETGARRWLAHPGGRQPSSGEFAANRSTLLAVGPEGGFSTAETSAARDAGWQLVGLGPRILRIETAALALVAALTLPLPAAEL